MADVKFTNNSDEVRAALAAGVERALEAIGLKAEGYAKRLCTVDTGRLRNSITHATADYSGQGTYTDKKGNQYSDGSAKTTPGDRMVVIGTNVEYAAYVEMGTSKTKAQPYLRPAVQNHQDEYIRMVKHFMKND